MGRDRTLPRTVLIVGLVAAAALALAFRPSDTGQLTGLVTAVDGDLTTVRSFEVLSDGDRFSFRPAPDGDFDFPLVHLRDHLRTGDPIAVEYQLIDGSLIASRVTDAD